ncbi:MAG: helix-turn-helix domain-containing protein [Bacteroidia bacterium]|nr:helix-turn-helix domain-containing protein [Bacteroidia bacterium]
MKNNPSITTELIAEKLNVTRRTILRDMEKLKKKAKVIYLGSQKKGYWQILKND